MKPAESKASKKQDEPRCCHDRAQGNNFEILWSVALRYSSRATAILRCPFASEKQVWATQLGTSLHAAVTISYPWTWDAPEADVTSLTLALRCFIENNVDPKLPLHVEPLGRETLRKAACRGTRCLILMTVSINMPTMIV